MVQSTVMRKVFSVVSSRERKSQGILVRTIEIPTLLKTAKGEAALFLGVCGGKWAMHRLVLLLGCSCIPAAVAQQTGAGNPMLLDPSHTSVYLQYDHDG